ncbi:MAG TPA: WYL domain-containing protein [Planctomycetaceae bacterium]|nr:WYL domain-containing protein [Planctomycetaceae bacterium]
MAIDASPLVSDTGQKNRWNVERRLEFIDSRLYWNGHINRGDLVDFFGISVPQASADLARYQEAAPGNVAYDKSAKTFVTGDRFQPAFFQPTGDGYLAHLRLLSSGMLSEQEAAALRPPPFSIVPILRRRVEPEQLRRVLKAIREKTALDVRYQSFSRTDPSWRWISPHALGFDGFRWHVRAWCHFREQFRDFVIARLLEVRDSKPSDADPRRDRGWHQEITLKIGPHPGMAEGARRAIELDFGMVDGSVEIKTRACLLFYVERFLGLDRDPSTVSPDQQQIVLINREEVHALRDDCDRSPLLPIK